jgi:spoIIIJ-associated protein
MESMEISGKTVEDAVQRASQQLGIPSEDLKFSIIKEGKSGILGFGSEEAVILVENTGEQPDESVGDEAMQKAREMLKELLEKLGFKAEVRLEQPITAEENGSTTTMTFNITGDDDIGILIGRHGQTLSSLQYLFRIILARQVPSTPSIIIDVDGYKQRRYESLRATATRLADQVKTRRTPFTLEPMPAFERRIIHMALANNPNVTTQSIGEGENRKVVIMPKNMGKGTRTVTNR